MKNNEMKQVAQALIKAGRLLMKASSQAYIKPTDRLDARGYRIGKRIHNQWGKKRKK